MRGTTEPVLIDGEWWFDYHGDEIGPYNTKAAALDDQRGLARFDKANPEFVPTAFEELLR